MVISDVRIEPKAGRTRIKAEASVKLDGSLLSGIRIVKFDTEYYVELPPLRKVEGGLKDTLKERAARRSVRESVLNEYILVMIERTSGAMAGRPRRMRGEEVRYMYAGWVHI